MSRALRTGTMLNGYRIEGVLSDAGNFSVVYVATDTDEARLARRRDRVAGRLGRWRDRYGAGAAAAMIDIGPKVAIKEYIPRDYGRRAANGAVLAERGQGDVFAWGRERFSREGVFLAAHSHPNVVAIFDTFADLSTEYYVMERLSGGSLGDVVARDGPQSEAQVRRWLMPLLDGLASVERRDTDHLDLSPGNIMFRTPGGDPVLVDFGAARIGGAPPVHSSRFVVDDNYAAPEKYAMTSGRLDARTDIYSLGAIVNFALTGEKPLKGNERVAQVSAASGLELAAQSRRARAASGDFLRVIDRAFATEIGKRYPDAGAFAQALGRGGGLIPQFGKPAAKPGASTTTPIDPRRRAAFILLGIAALFAVMILLGILASGS